MAKWFCNLILSIFQPKIVGQHQLIRKKEAPSYTQHKSEFSKSVNKISAQISTLPSAPLLFFDFQNIVFEQINDAEKPVKIVLWSEQSAYKKGYVIQLL